MSEKMLVLLSGGLDSTYNLYKAISLEKQIEYCVFFNYGQIAYKREFESVKNICSGLRIKLLNFDISQFYLDVDNIIYPENIDLDNNIETKKSMETVWIPNRNGLMINAAATIAEKNNIKYLICGFNKEEASTFKDNSSEFLKYINKSLRYSTSNAVEVICYSIEMTKEEIINDGLNVGVPLELIWSCYLDKKKMCGKCESCLRLKRAISLNGRNDEYRYLFT